MNPARFPLLRCLWMAVLCVLVCAGCDQSVKNTPQGAMDHFFALLGKQDFQGAYNDASLSLQEELSRANFEALCRDMKLQDFNAVTWTLDSIEGDEAHLTGEFTQKNDEKMPLTAVVIKQSGEWKLFSMFTPSPKEKGVTVDIFGRFDKGMGFNDAFTRALPSDAESKQLVRDTMLKINECLHKKNFETFYQDASSLWQSKATIDMVERSFKPFLDGGVTVDFVKDATPIFDEPPRLDALGHLVVKGYYPTHPNKLTFDLQYVFEMPKWKLVGLGVNFK